MIEFTDNCTRPSLKILCTLIRYPSAKNLPKKRRVIINVLEGKGIRTLMSLTDIKKTLEKLTVDIDAIADPHVAAVQRTLFGLVEALVEVNATQAKTIQQLKDEVNRLKGEQGVRHDVAMQTVATESHLYATYCSVSSSLPEHAIGVI